MFGNATAVAAFNPLAEAIAVEEITRLPFAEANPAFAALPPSERRPKGRDDRAAASRGRALMCRGLLGPVSPP